MKNDLNQLRDVAIAASRNKGFWEEEDTIVKTMEFAADSIGNSIFRKSDIEAVRRAFSCQRLMHIVSELGECMEAKRACKKADWPSYQSVLDEKGVEFDAEAFKKYIKDSDADEMADALILQLMTAGGEQINIGKHVEHKLAFNSTRPDKHGKEF